MQIEINSEQFGTLGKKLGLVKLAFVGLRKLATSGALILERRIRLALDAELEQEHSLKNKLIKKV